MGFLANSYIDLSFKNTFPEELKTHLSISPLGIFLRTQSRKQGIELLKYVT